MPAVSIKQRRAMAIAEHNPEELNKSNRGLLGMSHQQLHEFADTSEKGLPEQKKPRGLRAGAHDESGRCSRGTRSPTRNACELYGSHDFVFMGMRKVLAAQEPRQSRGNAAAALSALRTTQKGIGRWQRTG